MADLVIEIDMDGKCAKCGAEGTTGSGLCLKCVAKKVVEVIKSEIRSTKSETKG